MTIKTIDVQHAADLFDLGAEETSCPWRWIADVRARRNGAGRYMVVRPDPDDGTHWGVLYAPGGYPWDDLTLQSLPLTRLYPHTVTTVEWRTEANR